MTRALGHGLVAVRPEGLRLTAAGGTAGVVTGRTFRRDHFLVEVEPVGQEPGADGPERLEVAVGLQEVVPEVGAAVEVEMVLGAVGAVCVIYTESPQLRQDTSRPCLYP